MFRDILSYADIVVMGCVVPHLSQDVVKSHFLFIYMYAEAPDVPISLRSSAVFLGLFQNSEALTWLDVTEVSTQEASRLVSSFEHRLFRDTLQTFDVSMSPILVF